MDDSLRPAWARWLPQERFPMLLLTAGMSALVGFVTICLAIYVMKQYAVALFCGVPFMMGMLAPLLLGISAPRRFSELLAASILSQVCLFGGMLVFGIEGIFCIIMAAPLWLGIALLGTLFAFPLNQIMWRRHVNVRGFPVAGLLLLISVPAWMGAERVAPQEPPLLMVSTAITIDAPPDVVWQRVVSFPQMAEPGWSNGGWLFHMGIARPQRAEIEGTGVGATRYCVFSTGKAIEPVTTWIPGQLLEVDVIRTPPSMEETSLYPNLHPPHLEGYMESARARFELIDLGHGRTRLVGTSWYRNRMYPVAYWQWWSDRSIKAVQVHVLAHMKALSERDAWEVPHPERVGAAG